MSINQQLILAISETGQRNQNEDFILPNSTDIDTHVYVVCDGVGGYHKGEIASKIVAESVEFYLKRKNPFLFQNRMYLDNSLSFAEERLTEYIENHPESKGMASTVVCLEFDRKKIMGYWVGDSKLLHIRNGCILFESKDHSLFEELKETNLATDEELEDHPFKNYILKAVKGTHHPTKPEYYITGNLKPNDYFILTTDGITESIECSKLAEMTTEYEGFPDQLKNEILSTCQNQSQDNFSIQIIKLL